MKIKLLKDQTWSIGKFNQGQILEIGLDISEKIGNNMLKLGYAEKLDVDVKLPAAPENKAVNPIIENKIENKPEESVSEEVDSTIKFKSELIEKINSMTKKELIRYANKNKVKLPNGFVTKTTVLERVLEYMNGGKKDE